MEVTNKAVMEALDELDSHQTMSRYQCSKDLANTRLGISMAVDLVEAMPTVDAEPVRHGKWKSMSERDEIFGYVYMCDNCGHGFIICENFNYCPK